MELCGTVRSTAVPVPDPPYENPMRAVAVLEILDQKLIVLGADPVTAVIAALAYRYDEPSRLSTVPYVASELVVGVPDSVSAYEPTESVPNEELLNL